MMTRTIQLAVVGALLLSASPAKPCTDAGRYGGECPPCQVCSVYTGDCHSGQAPLCVCTGFCRGGLIWRFVPKAGMFLATEGDSLGGVFGLEIAPPVLGGHLSVHGEWMTEDLWRFGLVATLPVFDSMLIGISADGAQVFGDLDDNWYLFGIMGLRIWL